MPNGNLPFHAKNIYYYLVFLLAMGISVFMVFTISGFQMNYLSYLLYDKSHLSAVSRLLNQFVLRKLLFSVILFLIALVMLYLFYFSYYQLIYLKLSVVCLLSITYCITLSETDTIFYLGTVKGQFWQNASVLSSVFLVLFFFYVSFESFLEEHSFLFLPCTTLIYGAFAFFMGFRRYSQNVRLIPFLFLSLIILFLGLWVFCLFIRDFRTALGAVPFMAGCFYLLYANYLYRLLDYRIPVLNHRAAVYDLSLYVAVATAVYLLVVTLLQKRSLLMHRRDLNRKIKELEQSKSMLLGILYSNVKNYLFSAKTSLDSLKAQPGLPEYAQKDLEQVQSELSNIGTLYNQIHNYTIFYGNSLNLSQVPVNMDLFFRLLSERLSYAGLLLPSDSVQIPQNSGYADIYPEYLLQSLEDLTILLRQQAPEGRLTIKGAREALQVSLIFHFTALPYARGRQRGGRKVLKYLEYGPYLDLTAPDYLLSILKHQAKTLGGSVKVSVDSRFLLRISFPITRESPYDDMQKTILCPDRGKSSVKHLLFLTSDPVQMEQFQKMLPFDRYHITLVNDGDYYMQHPQELSTFSLLIVGNLYRHTYFRDFYTMVRREYPMTALPILLLLPDLYAENSFYIRSTINDYLTPPYSQVSLEKKIHSLVTVKKTADIALEAQLEFWQSQINPHFIFNSINSIMHMCIKEPMKAYELLDNFSEYLRGHLLSLSLDRISTIQKEIDLISAYLQIEKARFGDKIQYELDINCAEDFPILPLLIEPLIENSIKHSPMHKSGVAVSVQIFQNEEQLLIRVEDNGNGMSGETIRQILSNTYGSNSIGLNNVCSRLFHYYHTVPVIESTVGVGTTVQFTIDRNTDFSMKGGFHHA